MNPNNPNTQPTPDSSTPDVAQPSFAQPSVPVPSEPQPMMQPQSAINTAPIATTPPAAPLQGVNPGKGLGIGSLITSILGLGLVGVILGAIGLSKSKKAGMSNGLAIAGIVLGVLGMIVGLLFAVVAFNGIAELANACAEAVGGTVTLDNGTVVNCEA